MIQIKNHKLKVLHQMNKKIKNLQINDNLIYNIFIFFHIYFIFHFSNIDKNVESRIKRIVKIINPKI